MDLSTSRSLPRLRAALMGSAVLAGAVFSGAPSVLAADQSGCGVVPLDVEMIIDRSGSMNDNGLLSGGHVRILLQE